MEKKTSFECTNCGICCKEPTTQINITLLDIKWLSDYMKLSVKELFDKKIVSFVPFINEGDFSKFDVELGIKKPCVLHKEDKCSVYDARPMNCRTFPYWLINHSIEDETIDALKGIELDPITKIRYREYERMVGSLLLKESEKTDEFMAKIGASQKVDISKNPEFRMINDMIEHEKNKKKEMELVAKLIHMAEKKIGKKIYEKVRLIEKEIKNQEWDEKLDRLIAADVIIDGEITGFNMGNP